MANFLSWSWGCTLFTAARRSGNLTSHFWLQLCCVASTITPTTRGLSCCPSASSVYSSIIVSFKGKTTPPVMILCKSVIWCIWYVCCWLVGSICLALAPWHNSHCCNPAYSLFAKLSHFHAKQPFQSCIFLLPFLTINFSKHFDVLLFFEHILLCSGTASYFPATALSVNNHLFILRQNNDAQSDSSVFNETMTSWFFCLLPALQFH